MLFSIKDAADLILIDKATGRPALFVGYANATSTEWSSDSVAATAKGVEIIKWDNARQGVLTLETEAFDMQLLALAMGSKVTSGEIDVMSRKDVVLNSSLTADIGVSNVNPDTLTIVAIDRPGDPEHVGDYLFNQSASLENLPPQVQNLSLAVADDNIRVTFNTVNNATGYLLYVNDNEVSNIDNSGYTITGLTPETEYRIAVAATNDFGVGARSATITTTTNADGVTAPKVETASGKELAAAADNVGTIEGPDSTAPSYSIQGGIITFAGAVQPGQAFAIYYNQRAMARQTIKVESEVFTSSYEIYGKVLARPQDGSGDRFLYIHYPNARPQSNFTLAQSATEPISLSIAFDLLPDANAEGEQVMAEYSFID